MVLYFTRVRAWAGNDLHQLDLILRMASGRELTASDMPQMPVRRELFHDNILSSGLQGTFGSWFTAVDTL